MPRPPIQTGLAHRGALFPDDRPLFPPADCFAALGGRGAIERLVDGFYDRIERDPVLRPAFGRDLTGERQSQKRFFESWLGGEHRYFDWQPGMKIRHSTITISRGMAGRWLKHFLDSLGEVTQDRDLIAKIKPVVTSFAMALVNLQNEPSGSERLNKSCASPAVRIFQEHVARDNAGGITSASVEHPHIIPENGSLLLLAAAVRGKAAAVAELVAQGVNPNLPTMPLGGDCRSFQIPPVYMTPLCAAMMKRRDSVIEVLLERGAVYDIFTATCVGNLDDVRAMLDQSPELADAWDPACDVAAVTPLLHAVFAGRLEIAQLLFERGATVGANSARLLRAAADRGDAPMTTLLLDQGANAGALGAGYWAMHPAIAEKLLARGANVNLEPGRWIGLCCTGNSGHGENLPLALGMLECGADVTALYRGRTAMHHAAKAGFANIVAALIARGADVAARDERGFTPLDAVEQAGPSIDREAVRRVLAVVGG